jgi:hypothetical protein
MSRSDGRPRLLIRVRWSESTAASWCQRNGGRTWSRRLCMALQRASTALGQSPARASNGWTIGAREEQGIYQRVE